jgi:3',5'-cyclic AMP phosphodiesterase CpdA
MSVLLHLSDLHFGTERAPVIDALLKLTRQQQPELAVLSGDITQRAHPAQFQAARALMDQLATPFLAIPGNHDIPLFDARARFGDPYGNYKAAFGDNLEPSHSSQNWLVVCVNTTRWYRHKNGEVSRAQIARVAQELNAASTTQLRVVVVHQPVAVLQQQEAHNLLRGHRAALTSWASAGADLVLGGHIHLPYVQALPFFSRPMWAVQAGTAASSRVRGDIPNSVNILRWERNAPQGLCAIERWDYDTATQSFLCVTNTLVKPGAASQSPHVD